MATSAPKAVPKAVPKVVPPEGGEAAVAPKKSKKKLFIVLILLLILSGAGGGAAWYFLGQSNGGAHAKKKEEPPKPPVFAQLEPFTVNLQPENGEQYLQVAMTLQVADQAQAEQIKLYMPLVRSRLLLLLSSKKASEISTADGKKKLSDEIVAQLKQPFASQGAPQSITGVFFTSFVIQ